MAKDLRQHLYFGFIWISTWVTEFDQEIINTVARDKSDVQYIELDGNTGKNFRLLIIDELTRIGSLHVR